MSLPSFFASRLSPILMRDVDDIHSPGGDSFELSFLACVWVLEDREKTGIRTRYC